MLQTHMDLILCSGVPAWISDVGEMLGSSCVTPLRLPEPSFCATSSSPPHPHSPRFLCLGWGVLCLVWFCFGVFGGLGFFCVLVIIS